MANTTVNIDIQVQSKSLNELEKELADINAELKEVPVGSQAFKDLSTQAQGLTKDLNQAQQAAEGFTSEEKFRAADGAIKLMGGSLASVVGTLGVLGVESEAFGDFEKKAASAISVAIGFKDVGEGISQIGPLLGKIGTAVKGFSITTKQALIATGVGAFVVVLGTVIAYWDEITAAVEEFGEKIPFVGKAIQVVKDGFDALVNAFRPVLEFLGILPDAVEQANQAMIESNNELIKTHEREIALLEASGASAETVYKKKKELIEAELDNLKRNEADKEEIYKKETELQVLEAKEVTRVAKEEQDKRTEATKKATEERVKAEEEAAKKIKKAIEDAAADYNKQLADKAAINERKLALEGLTVDLIKDAEKRTQQELALEKKKLEEERRLKEESYRKSNDDRLISDGTFLDLLDSLNVEYKLKELLLEQQTQEAIDAIRDEGLEKEKARIKEDFDKKREKLEQYKELFTSVFDNITELSQQRYDRELLFLQRERSAIESNVSLTEEERVAALDKLAAKERAVEIRRIKAERDQFQIKQALLLAEEIMRTKFFVAEQIRINALTTTEATAAASSVAIEGAKQTGKAAMSLGSFVSTLGPLGIAVFAASIGGIIASIISARKNAKAQIAALGVPDIGGGGINASAIPAAPTGGGIGNAEERAPQQLMACPATKTYVLTGDVTSGMEAEAKINTKRTIG